MKKAISALICAPMAITGCAVLSGNDPAKSNPSYEVFSTTDNISDAWTKDYSDADKVVLDTLWKSTLMVSTFGAQVKNSSDVTCDDIVNVNTSLGNVAEPIKNSSLAYGDKEVDTTLKSAEAREYTSLKDGESVYYANGTGWVVGQDATHFFVATNHHVIFKPNQGSGSRSYLNGTGTIDECIVISTTNGATKKTVGIDKSIGDNGLILNGRDAFNEHNDDIDFAVVAIKKADIGITMPTLEISNKVPEQQTFPETRIAIANMLRENKLYTAGFPRGTKRPNMTAETIDLNYHAAPITIPNHDNTKTTWNYDYHEYNFYTEGGSSGSPVINADGKIEFINTLKIGNDQRIVNDDYWTQFRSAGIPAYRLDKLVQEEICDVKSIAMDSCRA